jgi:dihydrolipoamide dehydrogenase
VITSDELLQLEEQPRRLVVIGGSAVGVEFACIYRALGSEVTLLGRRTFLKTTEQQLARRLRIEMGRRGIDITIGVDFQEIAQDDDGRLQVRYERSGKAAVAEGDVVLLATGRLPYIEGLGLEDVGVRVREPGVVVDQYLETSVPGIYAIGDVLAGYMLAHVASREGVVAVENILTGRKRAMDYHVVPDTVFSIPEIGGVGLTEAEAKSQGIDYRVSRFPLNASGRAQALGEPEGQVRMICEVGEDGRAGRVLGVHMLGARAGDLLAEAAVAMRLGATARDIAETIHQHPTMSEAVMEAAMAQYEGAIHYDKIG